MREEGVCLFVRCVFLCQSVGLFICLFVCLLVCLFIYLSVCLFASLEAELDRQCGISYKKKSSRRKVYRKLRMIKLFVCFEAEF